MLQADPVRALLDIVTPLALGAVAVVGLMIRASMAQSATKHVEAAAAVKAELLAHSTELKEDLAVHTAEDRLQFKQINEKLDTLQRTKT